MKTKDSELNAYPLCWGSISKDFTIDNMKKLHDVDMCMIFQLFMVVLMKNHKILFGAYNSIIKSITGSLIIFEKLRKMTNDFFNKEIICHLSWFLEND